MKCNVIKASVGMNLKDVEKVEEQINAWLQANPGVKVLTISQVPLGNTTVLTTIVYE